MSVKKKLLGILKMAGLSLALVGGSLCEGIGLSHIFVGQHKAKQAVEDFVNSPKYQIVRQEKENELDYIREKSEQLDQRYEAQEIDIIEYNALKNAYNEQLQFDEDKFIEENLEKKENSEFKGLIKTGNNMENAGIVLAIIGGIAFSIKGYVFIRGSIELEEPCSVGKFIIETMQDVIDDDFEPDKKREKKLQKQQQKQEEKDKEFIDEDEQELGNIEDTYYN